MNHRTRLLTLACPVYFELLASVLAGIIDMLWVARLGGAAVAAVAVATSTENLLLGVILTAAVGTTVRVAHAAGARDHGALREAVRGGWALCAVLTPLVAVGGWLSRDPLAALVLGGGAGGGDAHGARALAAGYFAISLPGIAVFFAQNVLDGILKGTGDTRTPMRLSFLANALILVLDPLLIHGLLGLPALGVRGAALATVLGRAVALAAGCVALRRNPVLRAATRRTPPARSTLTAARRTAVTGAPMSADFVIRMAGGMVMVALVARVGVTAVAAYGIATKATYVATMAFYALRQAASIHTAHTEGTGRDDRAAIGRQALLTGALLGTAAAGALLVAAPALMRVFGADTAVTAAGAGYLRCLGPYLVLLACFIALGGVFQGSGTGRQLAWVTLAGTAVQLPLGYALSSPAAGPGLDLGLNGVALAMGLSAALQCLAVVGLFRAAIRDRGTPREVGTADAPTTPARRG